MNILDHCKMSERLEKRTRKNLFSLSRNFPRALSETRQFAGGNCWKNGERSSEQRASKKKKDAKSEPMSERWARCPVLSASISCTFYPLSHGVLNSHSKDQFMVQTHFAIYQRIDALFMRQEKNPLVYRESKRINDHLKKKSVDKNWISDHYIRLGEKAKQKKKNPKELSDRHLFHGWSRKTDHIKSRLKVATIPVLHHIIMAGSPTH